MSINRPTLYQLQARWDAEHDASRTRAMITQVRAIHRLHRHETRGLAGALALVATAFVLVWIMLP